MAFREPWPRRSTVPCTDQQRDGASQAPGQLRRVAALLALCILSACETPAPQPVHAPAPAPRRTPAPAPAPSVRAAHSADEYKRQMALRLVAANPKTYTTRAPDVLLAIPILEVEVNADGSVRHITVVRTPTQATDTVQLAIDAVRRAAPFGDATQVPRPWKFMQVFLFDDDRRFKPKVLD
jgi:hypothetical protein